MKKITIKELARIAQVSPALVSRVLNHDNKLRVADDTRERILRTALDTGYCPQPQDKQSDEGHLNVAIIEGYSDMTYSEDPFYFCVLDALKRYCARAGINTYFMFFDRNEYVSSFDCEVDGVIGIGRFGKQEEANIMSICRNAVFIDSAVSVNAGAVLVNASNWFADMLQHLYDLGHRRIAFFSGENITSFTLPMEMRKSAYESFMKRNQIFDESLIYIGKSMSKYEGYAMARSLTISAKIMPTAIMCANDVLACGVIEALKEQGYLVPEDVSVTGFYGLPISQTTTPPLTTGAVSMEHLAQLAVEMIRKQYQTRPVYCDFVAVNPKMVITRSVGKPRSEYNNIDEVVI